MSTDTVLYYVLSSTVSYLETHGIIVKGEVMTHEVCAGDDDSFSCSALPLYRERVLLIASSTYAISNGTQNSSDSMPYIYR